MAEPLFPSPFVSWAGVTTAPDLDAASVAEFNQFYDRTHLPEILRDNPGFLSGTRFQLLHSDPRGQTGPGWLAMYHVQDEASARAHVAQTQLPREQRPQQTAGPAVWNQAQRLWRLMWRKVVSVDAASVSGSASSASKAPYAIYMVGMNVPPDTDADGLAAFNRFYTDVHVPEVLAAGGYSRGTRFELYHPFETPPSAAARFVAVYEADEAATRRLLERSESAGAPPAAGGGLSEGPPTWQQHQTLWRLVYRALNA